LVAEGFADPVPAFVSRSKDFGTVLVGPTQPLPSQLASKPVKGSGTDDPFMQMAFVELSSDDAGLVAGFSQVTHEPEAPQDRCNAEDLAGYCIEASSGSEQWLEVSQQMNSCHWIKACLVIGGGSKPTLPIPLV